MPIIDAAATALLTYAAHGFAACAVALITARFIRRPHDRDIVWKAALIAPIALSACGPVTARPSTRRRRRSRGPG